MKYVRKTDEYDAWAKSIKDKTVSGRIQVRIERQCKMIEPLASRSDCIFTNFEFNANVKYSGNNLAGFLTNKCNTAPEVMV